MLLMCVAKDSGEPLKTTSCNSYQHVTGLIEICRDKRIPYIAAPFEADVQLAYLSASGRHVDAVLTEDSDLLAYGCKKVIFKLKLSGQSDFADVDFILQSLQLHSDQFLYMCIVAGCDFLSNIRGIGIHKAWEMVSGNADFLECLRKHKYAPPDFIEEFKQACAVFRQQMIYDVDSQQIWPLSAWTSEQEKEQFSRACGIFPSDAIADFVVGNIDMATMEKKNSFPIHKDTGTTGGLFSGGMEMEHNTQDELSIPDVALHIENIEDRSFKWRIPCFPVMELEFKHALATIDGKKQTILLSKGKSALKCPVNVRCTSHCNIIIHDESFLVVWNFNIIENNADAEGNDSDSELISGEQHLNIPHTLPFKVLGVSYCKNAQDHLEAAYDCLYGEKQNVYAKVFAEPQNTHDRKAVAVAIKYNDSWVKISYIAAELTKFLHAIWECDSDVNVTVKHIKFRTTHLKVGFYITILITKRGEWPSEVINASKAVQ